MENILKILPINIQEAIDKLPKNILKDLQEIRIREDRPLELVTHNNFFFIEKSFIDPNFGHESSDAKKTTEIFVNNDFSNIKYKLTQETKNAIVPSQLECTQLLNMLTKHSLYSMEEELRQGYITINGGHRVGLVGKVILEKGSIKQIRDVTGFNIRIAKSLPGIAEDILPYIFSSTLDSQLVNSNAFYNIKHSTANFPQSDNNKTPVIHNVLIVSAPNAGKTTLLRELTRIASSGSIYHPAIKTSIVDERSEIAACSYGIPQFDIGPRTDVLDGCPKAEGITMLLRTMSPQLIVVDEIATAADTAAVYDVANAGVKIFCTAHGQSLEDIMKRPNLSVLINREIFSRILFLSSVPNPGNITAVYNSKLQKLPKISTQISTEETPIACSLQSCND